MLRPSDSTPLLGFHTQMVAWYLDLLASKKCIRCTLLIYLLCTSFIINTDFPTQVRLLKISRVECTLFYVKSTVLSFYLTLLYPQMPLLYI